MANKTKVTLSSGEVWERRSDGRWQLDVFTVLGGKHPMDQALDDLQRNNDLLREFAGTAADPICTEEHFPASLRFDHYLKCWPSYFEAVAAGEKTHELRKEDRDFRVGQVILLEEYDIEIPHYTGRLLPVRVTYISRDVPGFGLVKGYCILSIQVIHRISSLVVPSTNDAPKG